MILYQDAALVVVNKPAGLSSEAGLPARLRELWRQPDAYVGIVHRLDTGVSGLMVCARTPKAAAALTRQITQSQEAYAVLDGRAAPAQNTLPAPVFTKQYRADPSDPGAVRLPAASALGRRQIRQPFQGNHCTAERTALFSAPGDRGADGVRIGKAGHGTMERLTSAFGRSVHSIFSPSA